MARGQLSTQVATDVPLLHSFGPHRLDLFKVWTYEEKAPAMRPVVNAVDRTVSAQILQ